MSALLATAVGLALAGLAWLAFQYPDSPTVTRVFRLARWAGLVGALALVALLGFPQLRTDLGLPDSSRRWFLTLVALWVFARLTPWIAQSIAHEGDDEAER